MNTNDTIAAIASAPGSAVRGIIRVSGDKSLDRISACCDGDFANQLRKRAHAKTTRFRLPSLRSEVQVELYIWPTKRSYTGQPSVEIHTIGSAPILEAILDELCHEDVRLARAGEFTLRAFLAGRLDLPQAEAVLGVIDSTTDRQLTTALTQLSGGLSKPLNHLRNQLLNLLADLEAGLDFADEDIEFVSNEDLLTTLREALDLVSLTANQLQSRSETTELPRVVLYGAPNAGKSTLWNRLLNRDQAIVSHQPGTTRDYLSEVADFDGWPCLLMDTAGVSANAVDEIDQIAQTSSHQAQSAATIRILCVDSTMPATGQPDFDKSLLERAVVVHTKSDVSPTHETMLDPEPTDLKPLRISAMTGQGMTELKKRIIRQLDIALPPDVSSVASTANRCRESLRNAARSIQSAIELASNQLGDELVSAEIRIALDELGQVVGAVYTDDILDRIFSRFCIGK